MGFLQLLRSYPRLLCFGVLSSLCSSFGQTFFLSLFVPHIADKFDLTVLEFGALYAVLTVISAVLLSLTGGWIDSVRVQLYAMFVATILIFSALTLAWSPNYWAMTIGLLGVRFAGQGLFTHLATTTISRSFSDERGKALSVSSVGHPLGEAFLPLIVVYMSATLEWYAIWLFIAACLFFIYCPLALLFLAQQGRPVDSLAGDKNVEQDQPAPPRDEKKQWTRKEVFSHPMVWFLLPHSMAAPFLLTGLFFHQVTIGGSFGFEPTTMASAFLFFGIARGVSAFAVGPWIDRIGAIHLLPFTLLPLLAGVLVMGVLPNTSVVPIYLGLAGMSVGFGAPVKSAFLVEAFGTTHLGSIRSVFATLGVLSTAACPPLMGFYLEQVGSAQSMFVICATGCGIVSALALFACLRLRKSVLASSN
jgi:sugar phosphate permease